MVIANFCAFFFVEAIPSSGNLYLVWDMAPTEIIDGFLKVFVYQHEKSAYNKYK